MHDFWSIFGAQIYLENLFFARFFSFFFDSKIARDDSGSEHTNSDFGTYFFCKKNEFISVHEKTYERKDIEECERFLWFFVFLCEKIEEVEKHVPGVLCSPDP